MQLISDPRMMDDDIKELVAEMWEQSLGVNGKRGEAKQPAEGDDDSEDGETS